MLYKSTPLELVEIKAGSDGSMQFTAYASTFNNKDHGGDVITKGAFAETLAARKFRPLLWQHDMREPIGIEKSLKEDGKGLLGTWQLVDTQRGEDAYKLLKAGAVRSMSIGYIPSEFAFEDEGDTRVLNKVDLLENSVVSLPMNEQAQVQSVKEHVHCALCQALIDESDEEVKATWSTAFINNLPDSAFAYIEPGGSKDGEGKTEPRSKRHFPHHGTGGAIDLSHLRNALARAPQSPFGPKAMPHLRKHAQAEGVGDMGKQHDPIIEVDYEDLTLAQLASVTNDVVAAFGERTRDLLDKLSAGDFSLTEAKRTDLQALLETFSGIDAVRHDAEAVLAHKQEQVPDPNESQVRTTALTLELVRHRLRARGVEV